RACSIVRSLIQCLSHPLPRVRPAVYRFISALLAFAMKLVPKLVIFVSNLWIHCVLSWQVVRLYEFHNIGEVLAPIDAATHVGGELGRNELLKRKNLRL